MVKRERFQFFTKRSVSKNNNSKQKNNGNNLKGESRFQQLDSQLHDDHVVMGLRVSHNNFFWFKLNKNTKS